jgi:F0F1-type ATP synthase assembly protein I
LLALALASIGINLAGKFAQVAPVAVILSFLVGFIVNQLPVARDIV